MIDVNQKKVCANVEKNRLNLVRKSQILGIKRFNFGHKMPNEVRKFAVGDLDLEYAYEKGWMN